MESKKEIKKELNTFGKPNINNNNSDKREKRGDRIKRQIEERENIETNKHIKLIRTLGIVGNNPNMMIQMLYDKKTKTPFKYSMTLGNNGIHIYAIFKWGSDNNIQFTYNTDGNEIIMYAYTFRENNYEHDLIICDIASSKTAIHECERQKLIPFNDSTYDNYDFTKYDNILKVQKNGKLSGKRYTTPIIQNSDNYISSDITTNIITFDFINYIVKYMKDTKKSIKIMGYNVIDFSEAT